MSTWGLHLMHDDNLYICLADERWLLKSDLVQPCEVVQLGQAVTKRAGDAHEPHIHALIIMRLSTQLDHYVASSMF